MEKNKKSKFKYIISLKDLVAIFVKKKWIFIGFFLITLIIGLAITFLKTPVFQSSSVLRLGDTYFEENLYKYYPEEAKELGIFAPGLDIDELEGSALGKISRSIRSDELFEEVLNKIDIDIDKEELRTALATYVDRGKKIIRIVITHPDAEDSYEINLAIINTFLSNNFEKRSIIIEDLEANIEKEISVLENDILALENGDKDDSNDEIKPEAMEAIIIDLNKIKYNLENNRVLYISNIEISEEPGTPSEPINADYLKNVLIVIFVSIAVGLIAVYSPSIFTTLKD